MKQVKIIISESLKKEIKTKTKQMLGDNIETIQLTNHLKNYHISTNEKIDGKNLFTTISCEELGIENCSQIFVFMDQV